MLASHSVVCRRQSVARLIRVSDPEREIQLTIMKNNTRNTRGLGAWVLGGVASLLLSTSALGQFTVTQPTAITINDNGVATPYPSSIFLTNAHLVGVLQKVEVQLDNVSHPYAPDVGLLLVGPNGQAVVLMS